MPLRPGDMVEHFVIDAPLGAGGMGQVYLARDTRLQRSVALKIVRPEPESVPGSQPSSDGAVRLLREAQAAAALEHPNVVTIYEVGEIRGTTELDGCPFIAMELVKGRPLRDYVGDPHVPLRERLRWLLDVARALGAAHKTGLVHRDMKPENVMIRDDGVVKVLDFGLAKRASGPASGTSSTQQQMLASLTAKGMAVGTPYYMAPEQMMGEPLDGRADQFGWAVMAYELLSGTGPWGGVGDALELVSKVLTRTPEPLANVASDVPAHVSRAVDKALSKKREGRFANMAEVIAAIENATDAYAPTDPPPPLPAESAPRAPAPVADVPTLKSSRPSRAGVSALATRLGLGCFVLGALGTGVWAFAKRRDPPRPSTAGAAPAPHASPARECTHNAECVARNGGKPAVCNATGHCALVESQDCTAKFAPADLARDDAIWLGAMYPLHGDDAFFGVSGARAFDLGREDFAALATAEPTSVRPFDVVVCDDSADPRRAARHLADDVGVPAVVGFRSSDELLDLAGSVFLPHGQLVIAAVNTSPLVTQIPEPPGAPRLVWRTTYNLAATAKPLALFVARTLEPMAKAGKHGAPMRIAFLRGKQMSALALSRAVTSELTFNGKSAIENGDAFREIVADDSAASYREAAGELTAFAPDIVLYLGGGAIFRGVVETAEAAWAARPGPRPLYAMATVLPDETFAFVGTHRDRRRRFFGMTTRSTTAPNAHFVMHFNESAEQKTSRTSCPNESYDAFYVLAYAALAAGSGPLTGSALSKGIARLLPPGRVVEVGPTGIFDAIDVLGHGERIDLEGATGKLDFDLAHGEAPVDFAVLCVDADAQGKAIGTIESGVVYDSTHQVLEGQLACP